MSRLIALVVGVYGGMYIDQNYQIMKLPGPLGLWEHVKSWTEQFKKGDKD